MGMFLNILTVIVGVIVVFAVYVVLTNFVFNKVTVNKWILLALGLGLLLLGFFIINNNWIKMICQGIGIVILLWFFDVYNNGNPNIKKEKKVVIKAKAKPNRVKKSKK